MSIREVTEIDDLVPVNVILASVFNKSGLEALVPGVIEHCSGVQFVSTGGTYGAIKNILEDGGHSADDYVMPIEKFTGAPETEGGLVKTLSREKSLALLSETYCESHQNDLKQEGVIPIDVVIGNLYPFQNVVIKNYGQPEKARGNIDIGGPNMIREAAKNFIRCVSIVDPEDYTHFLEELKENNGRTSLDFRLHCMKKAFDHVASYNTAIADYFADVTPKAIRACYKTVHNRGEVDKK
ncbi:hypothetical protein HQ545_04005 [Candidatus Woesearchaeota archaeon]|nr:hypothetical protein [Candidatus Woesearchaeota archaeon]